jgi:Rtr1/RPAP2 family
LNESYYNDVVDERNCGRLCGYPLCSNPPSEKWANQKFHISSQLNKVFDVTDRKVRVGRVLTLAVLFDVHRDVRHSIIQTSVFVRSTFDRVFCLRIGRVYQINVERIGPMAFTRIVISMNGLLEIYDCNQ